LHVYYGAELLEVVPEDRNRPAEPSYAEGRGSGRMAG